MKKLGIFVAGAIVFSSAAHAYDYKVERPSRPAM